MKNKFLFGFLVSFILFNLSSAFAQYTSQNINLLSHWDNSSVIAEPAFGIRYSSVWGWVDPKNKKEYAIIGGSDGTYFIDVTDRTSPTLKDFVPGRRDSCIWREYKTYKNFLYAVSDDAVDIHNQNSMQIIDMSYLPDSVHVVYDQDTLSPRTHSLFIDEINAKLYLNSTYLQNHGGHSNMAILSLANPKAPTLIRKLEDDFPASDNVHDCYVRNDTIYASSSYGGMFIYKFTGTKFILLASLTKYLEQGYNHSSALTANGKTLIFTDEVPARQSVKALDVSDFGNLSVLNYFKPTAGDTATPHNPFIRNGDNSRVVIAYYQDGVQIFDISNPSKVTRTGYFDTNPTDCPYYPNSNYTGCWGVYVDLPSGIILASDMQSGLFVLDAAASGMGIPYISSVFTASIFPNPATENTQLELTLSTSEIINYQVTDLTGKLIMNNEVFVSNGKSLITIDTKNIQSGSYLLTLKNKNIQSTLKFIKIN